MTTERAFPPDRTWVPGVAISALLSVAWVALSLRTGLNHHLFPLAIAAVPTAMSGILGSQPLSARVAPLAAAGGFALVWLTWLAFAAIDETPTAVFFEGQPGGAIGEAAMLSVAGALGGYFWNWGRLRGR